MITDSDILHTATANATNMDALVKSLIDQANAAGGADNVSVCAARVLDPTSEADFEEVRRVTVDWGGESEMNALEEICSKMFQNLEVSEPAPVGETQNFKTTDGKKKRKVISPLAIVIFLVVVVVILALWYSS
jgi:hypothetical protein